MNTNADRGWITALQQRALELAAMPERERRHLEVVQSVQERTGLPLPTVELAYEIALEEGLDPALALELLVSKVAVIDLAEPLGEEAHSLAPPEWVVPVGLPDQAVVIERRLRLTFRRLRAMLQRHEDVADAIAAFGREPDVAAFDYGSVAYRTLD